MERLAEEEALSPTAVVKFPEADDPSPTATESPPDALAPAPAE